MISEFWPSRHKRTCHYCVWSLRTNKSNLVTNWWPFGVTITHHISHQAPTQGPVNVYGQFAAMYGPVLPSLRWRLSSRRHRPHTYLVFLILCLSVSSSSFISITICLFFYVRPFYLLFIFISLLPVMMNGCTWVVVVVVGRHSVVSWPNQLEE